MWSMAAIIGDHNQKISIKSTVQYSTFVFRVVQSVVQADIKNSGLRTQFF